ncbi:hypothetical protein DDE05_34685, partial [Streptomyces cavourensis]
GIERAVAGNRAGLPLVVVAHSMGGNIVYDVLSHFRPDLTVDTLVTVGSQVGLFEELKLFGASRPEINGETGGRVPLPPGLGRWINVVDHSDLLAYRVGPIFDGGRGLRLPVGGRLGAHRVSGAALLPCAARPAAAYGWRGGSVTRVFDRRITGTALHALVIGVGRYPHCGPGSRSA